MSGEKHERNIRKSERTCNKITDAFLDIMKEKRWDRISVKELCAACSITRGTFYQYFSDIYDLMEGLENRLLEELTAEYSRVTQSKYAAIPEQLFYDRFDYSPHEVFAVWFRFVGNNKKAVFSLIDRKNGDPYFVEKLKHVMTRYLNLSMDNDGLPDDKIRPHFIQLLLEMHFLSAQIWIEHETEDSPPVEEIVHLLNNMRVGSVYVHHKSKTDPDYEKKIKQSLT